MATALKDATAVVFDLRAGAVHPWLSSLQFLPLAKGTMPFPAHRFRLHHGNITPRGAEDTAYFSGLVTRTAPVPGGSIGTRDVPAVFLVRDSSQVPLLAVAMQAARRGHIIAESPIDDRHIARHAMTRHHQLPLIAGYVAHVRTSEMLHSDGTTGLFADRVVNGDGLPLAIAAAQGRVTHAERPPAGPAYRVKVAEAPYADEAFPSASLRVLAAFRFLGVFEWLYPYRDLICRDVADLVRDALPPLLSASNALEYHLAVAAMVAQVGDTHADTVSRTLTDAWGHAVPPVTLRPVEGRAVIVGVGDEARRATTETRLDVALPVRGSETPYRGKTVMLIDDRAQSQSEATAVLLKAVAGTVMIGTPTAGALGEGSGFTVPGGIGIGLTGTSVAVGGRLVQRVGVQPDVVAAPTIAGIRAGRDEVLDQAIEFLTTGH